MRKLIDRWAGSSGSEGLFCDEGEHLWESLLQRLGGRAQVLQKFLACDLPPIDQVRDGLERKHGNLQLVADVSDGSALHILAGSLVFLDIVFILFEHVEGVARAHEPLARADAGHEVRAQRQRLQLAHAEGVEARQGYPPVVVDEVCAQVGGPDLAPHRLEAAASARVDHHVRAEGLDGREGGDAPADRADDVDAVQVALAVEDEVDVDAAGRVLPGVALGAELLREGRFVLRELEVVDEGPRLGLHR
eukprot:CAMPEP_0197488904 /NCGR_PEP_ID=MMETSP1311-20131121/3804_1 /TAXON_ID=464262 /ORGANISM="Genus nov. species nov., Strain RCC856" /LENGTH=247 /DNA_ID=CAMNT_0043033109 /DNA_START=729 /DNA_END=1468 /DNA_ORIENTATION=-